MYSAHKDMHHKEHVRQQTSKFLGWPGARQAKFPEQKFARFFSRNHGKKSGEKGEKIRYDTSGLKRERLSCIWLGR
jgi:hypothetical protein